MYIYIWAKSFILYNHRISKISWCSLDHPVYYIVLSKCTIFFLFPKLIYSLSEGYHSFWYFRWINDFKVVTEFPCLLGHHDALFSKICVCMGGPKNMFILCEGRFESYLEYWRYGRMSFVLLEGFKRM